MFEELGAKVIAIHTKPDGKNINARAGALHPQAMCETVQAHDAHLGIALDGDADRVRARATSTATSSTATR